MFMFNWSQPKYQNVGQICFTQTYQRWIVATSNGIMLIFVQSVKNIIELEKKNNK